MEGTKARKFDGWGEVPSSKRPRLDLSGLSGCSNPSCQGTPKRFMFYESGSWHDFPSNNSSALCEAFSAGKIHVEVLFRSCIVMVSFLQKLQVNLHTGYQQSVGWVEECGKLNIPCQPFEGTMPRFCRRSSTFSRKKVSAASILGSSSCETYAGRQDGCEASVSTTVLKSKSHGRLKKLLTGEPTYEEVKKIFQDGLGMLSTLTQMTSIYEVLYEGVGPQARLQSFLERKQATKLRRDGDANVQYAWYGCSKSELLTIVQHGFGKPTMCATYGTGVYLAPKQYSGLSCLGADVDDKSELYAILCEVILGRSELVRPGTKQFHPSNEDFDTGVDHLLNPKRYIVWSTHMNTHILPKYIVCFRLRGTVESSEAPACLVKSKLQDRCIETSTTNPKLFVLLKPELPASEMQLLEQHYHEFKCGKLTREEMLRKIRAVAGDGKLRRIQQQVQASNSLSGFAHNLSNSFN